MKAIPYLLSGVLIAPGVLLAYFIWTVKEAIRQASLFKFLVYLLVQAVQMMEWGIYVILAALALWITLAFIDKYRWLGALGMAVVAVLSLVVMLVTTSAPKSVGELWFPAMSAAGLAINVWLIWDGFSLPAPGK
jgi:hypothetical protein